ncbi:MAG TPA: 4Fe-4S dicluster domain-containing protein [Candidatus Ozemobacteraceae bacterium]|nr:4Fe-4S dicluster domain-containing protein [Candidatus Ozemobacteraceae bacterium]
MVEHARCVNCLACAEACPRGLFPSLLFHAVLRGTDDDEADAAGLMHCCLCHTCQSACPVGIPLTDVFAAARDSRAGRGARP